LVVVCLHEDASKYFYMTKVQSKVKNINVEDMEILIRVVSAARPNKDEPVTTDPDLPINIVIEDPDHEYGIYFGAG
ncbi:unnamed protein product, partial [Didymodactylos carnosus]